MSRGDVESFGSGSGSNASLDSEQAFLMTEKGSALHVDQTDESEAFLLGHLQPVARKRRRKIPVCLLAVSMILFVVVIDVGVLRKSIPTLCSRASFTGRIVVKSHSRTIISTLSPSMYLQTLMSRPHPLPVSETYSGATDFCSICDCSSTPPSLNQLYHTHYTTSKSLSSFLLSSILDIQCKHTYAKTHAALTLIEHSITIPDRTFAWNVSSIKEDIQTAYIFTKTSPAGKTDSERSDYMQRHVDTFTQHQKDLATQGTWFDGRPISARQTIWIIVEDGAVIDEELASVLALSSIDYIYFAFGPTRHFGNGQHNAAFSMIHALSNAPSGTNKGKAMLRMGPVLGVDDDAEIHPALLQLIWKVQKVGIWPMGNLVRRTTRMLPRLIYELIQGPTGWEGPVFDNNGRIIEWAGGNTVRLRLVVRESD